MIYGSHKQSCSNSMYRSAPGIPCRLSAYGIQRCSDYRKQNPTGVAFSFSQDRKLVWVRWQHRQSIITVRHEYLELKNADGKWRASSLNAFTETEVTP